MPVAECVYCPRTISLSIQKGGNACAGQGDDSPAASFGECLSCGRLACDSCMPATCGACGGEVVRGDGRRLAIANVCGEPLGYDLASFADGLDEPQRDAWTAGLVTELHQEQGSRADAGTLRLIDSLLGFLVPRTVEGLRAGGSAIDEGTVHHALREQLLLAHAFSQVLTFLPRGEEGSLDADELQLDYRENAFLQRDAMRRMEECPATGALAYPGIAVAALRANSVLDRALSACESFFLFNAQLDPERVSEELCTTLVVATKMGFTAGCVEGVARARGLLLAGASRRVHRRMAEHFLDHANASILCTPSSQDEAEAAGLALHRVAPVVIACRDDHRPDIRAGARAMLRVLGLEAKVPVHALYERALEAMGEGEEADAVRYLTQAGEAGSPHATYALAIFHENGIAVGKSQPEYARLMTRAAAAGYRPAQGECLIEGLGVARNAARGLALLTHGAEHEPDGFAQVNLAAHHLAGEIVPRDPAVARRWLQTAVVNQNPLALHLLCERANAS